MASATENRVVNLADLVQGITLVTFLALLSFAIAGGRSASRHRHGDATERPHPTGAAEAA